MQHIDLWCTNILFTFSGSAHGEVVKTEPLVINLLEKDWEDVSLAGLVAEIAAEVGLEPQFAEPLEESDEDASDSSSSNDEVD